MANVIDTKGNEEEYEIVLDKKDVERLRLAYGVYEESLKRWNTTKQLLLSSYLMNRNITGSLDQHVRSIDLASGKVIFK